MATNMRGLTQFIADIRGARVRDLEEKRINKEMANIRKKFKDGNLDGYQKKKYVAKVLYTYILGYKVDVGHMEAVNLISSHKYSEKQIVSSPSSTSGEAWRLDLFTHGHQGYLAVTLLMHENSDFLRLVVNSIRKDLDENNEINNCLALHAIANVGGTEMAEALSEDVHRLLISPTSQTMVKKKAALTLLRLYRKHPDVIPAAEWALRIVSIMDDTDLGVVLCVTTLVMALAQDHPEPYAVCYQKGVDRLYRLIVDHEYSATYAYYKVPSPWLQVKLLRLLQYYPPPDDPAIRATLLQVLETIMNNSAEQTRNMQHNNAQRAVLFEAIGLAIHLDSSSPLVSTAAVLLARFISSKETNVRYLGLDTLAHLAARADSLEHIKTHQAHVISSLRDRDISVRRRALDLLYSMCDVDNSEVIVGELLQYLKVADYALREEMVLKIALLTEKYASSYRWYVDTILELISAAGDHVGDEVWYRVVQIITNTEDLQAYAARVVFQRLKAPATHESLVKIGGYVLGEYGHLVADEEGHSPIEQLQVLHTKSQFCTAPTRALLLTTYIKWVNVFPEIKPQLINIFERYRHVLDSELQQRACEFYALASRPDDDELLQNVCEEIPPFPPRESALLSRLNKKHGATEDKRTWVHGGKDVNQDREAAKNRRSSTSESKTNGVVASPGAGISDVMTSLQGLDLLSGPSAASASLTTPSAVLAKPTIAPHLAVGTMVDRWFEKLTYSNEGVLYEDVQIQVGIKSRYQAHIGQLAVYMGNKVSAPFTSFTTKLDVDDPEALSVTFAKMPASMVPPRSQSQQILHVECKKVFTTPPIITISFLAGSHQTIALRLPVVLTKFIEPITLGAADFFERWRLIGGPPREAQSVFPINLTASGDLNQERHQRVISGHKLSILPDVDPNPDNFVGAGVLHMSGDGKVGCLLRVEPNRDAKLCRITVRSTSEDVVGEMQRLIQKPLSVDAAS
ncbi:Adaptor protein complex AP-2 alpha subunit [Russula earlei]|uniref:Adaptor protein complex AP-2 alpha subunit n=1 Tax=Russula earlei TaxID=71964 RepID=A0ACC0ULH8_9AGAM|nr:Adaptor protein complex AP-2 alpha subunit [Russula earlei]